jgi:hypothetical protein
VQEQASEKVEAAATAASEVAAGAQEKVEEAKDAASEVAAAAQAKSEGKAMPHIKENPLFIFFYLTEVTNDSQPKGKLS